MDPIISSYCLDGECCEVTFLDDGGVLMRSTLRPDEVVLFTGAEWDAFEAGARGGEFRRPSKLV